MTRLESETTTLRRPEKRGRNWLQRGVALASVALATAAPLRAIDNEEHHPEPTQQAHVLRDSNGNGVTIGPEQTITLPSRGGDLGEHYYPNHPVSQEATRNEAGYCQVVDVPLPKRFAYGEIAKGAETEFVLSHQEAQWLQDELLSVESIKDIQAVMTPKLAELGIKARYDAPISQVGEVVPGKTEGSRSVLFYRNEMMRFVEALALMPREMIGAAKSVNFLDVESFRYTQDKEKAFALGLYSPASQEITLAMGSMNSGLVIHEFAHALHAKACEGSSDTELEREFNEAMAYVRTLRPELEDRFKDSKRVLGDELDYEAYIEQGREAGFPTDYSRENYVELLADLTKDLILQKGYLAPSAEAAASENDTARQLREMVVERLQEAMPGVDVPAYLAFMNTYDQAPPSMVDPKEVIKHKVSPLDATFAYFSGLELEGYWKLTPVIAIRAHGDVPEQYVYAYEKEGDSGRAVEIHINIPHSAQGGVGDMLIQAGLDYIESDPANKGLKVRVLDGKGVDDRDEVVRIIAYVEQSTR